MTGKPHKLEHMTNEDFSYVYFGIAKDRSGFKIGVSQNPPKRASSFSTEMDLEDSMQFRCKRSDAFRMEKTIHFLFDKYRLVKDKSDGYTEWFDFAVLDEIRCFVLNNKEKFKLISFEPMLKTQGLPHLMFWLDSYRQGFLKLGKDRDITGEAHRILWYLFDKLDFDHYTHVQQTEISEALDLQKSHVSRAVKVLCDKQIILKGPKTGRIITYRLNSEYGWKGKVKNMNASRFTVIQGGKDTTTGKDGEAR
jgi:hypothetical protein